jgi:hypothetical protein
LGDHIRLADIRRSVLIAEIKPAGIEFRETDHGDQARYPRRLNEMHSSPFVSIEGQNRHLK